MRLRRASRVRITMPVIAPVPVNRAIAVPVSAALCRPNVVPSTDPMKARNMPPSAQLAIIPPTTAVKTERAARGTATDGTSERSAPARRGWRSGTNATATPAATMSAASTTNTVSSGAGP